MIQTMKWALLLCLLIAAIPAGAQTANVVGYSTLDYDAQTNTMIGTCTMDPSYTTKAYYADPYSVCGIAVTGTETLLATGLSSSLTTGGAPGSSPNSTVEYTPSAGVSYTAWGSYGFWYLTIALTYAEYGTMGYAWDPDFYSYFEQNPEDCLESECTWQGVWTPTIYVQAYVIDVEGGVPSNPVTATLCSISITPTIFQASNCNGQSAINGVITANLSPTGGGGGQCYVNASSASSYCVVAAASGNIDVVNAGPNDCTLTVNNPANPVGQFGYFAGPGTSGQHVGTIQAAFSLLVNTVVVTQNATIPVQCP